MTGLQVNVSRILNRIYWEFQYLNSVLLNCQLTFALRGCNVTAIGITIDKVHYFRNSKYHLLMSPFFVLDKSTHSGTAFSHPCLFSVIQPAHFLGKRRMMKLPYKAGSIIVWYTK